jgi:3-oxoisoapionate decarboxylase
MPARIGFDHYSIANRGFTANETLDFAKAHRFDGVQFLEPASIDESLESGRLAHFRRRAEAMELYLEVGLRSPNPVRRSRELDREISAAEFARELGPQIDALAELGCRHTRLYVGDRHDRFRQDTPWELQVAATVDVIGRLTPRLKERGIRLAIENHADLTTQELLDVLERIDPDVAGVTLDTGNLLMRLDDPLDSAERLAPFVLSTHIKDAVLAFTQRGMCWQARPVGSGILPLPDMLAAIFRFRPTIALSIELHPRIYDLPIFDARWLGFFPGLRPQSLAAVVRLAADCERRYVDGSLVRPEVVEATPWGDRDLDWLARSLGYLRSVVPTLIETAYDPAATNAANLTGEMSSP